MNDSELCFLSANEVLAKFRSKELSPVELLDALTDRIEAIEPQINAVCDRRYDEARAEAVASADRYAGKGDAPRALEGVPVAAKEEQAMVGRINSYGSLVYADQVATDTHPMLQRIQDAGGIIHIRTTTPEFSCAGFTHSRLWGITRNPWNTDFTPGGSSGGSGASLAAGYAPLATGSDIGGSIRMPASFCGVVGFKPPFGRVPAMPPFNLDQYCHDGPMARTIADTALLTNVIAGRHPADVVSMPAPPHLSLEAGSISDLRIALCITLGNHQVDAQIEANTRRAAAVLEGLGATVVEVELPWTVDQLYAAARSHFGGIFGPSVAKDLEAHGDLLTTYASAFARDMASSMDFIDGLVLEGEIYRPLGALLAEYDALICPTMGTTGLLAGDDQLGAEFVLNGVTLPNYLMAALTPPFNIASRCPVLAVPTGVADNGVPTGAQIVGRTYEDATPFRIGLAYEHAVGGFPHPTIGAASVSAS
ncbi:MAG: amidase [Ilumatobacteraceae bacterium]|nr:amidase [Ilumatobacteraceae bacterium]